MLTELEEHNYRQGYFAHTRLYGEFLMYGDNRWVPGLLVEGFEWGKACLLSERLKNLIPFAQHTRLNLIIAA